MLRASVNLGLHPLYSRDSVASVLTRENLRLEVICADRVPRKAVGAVGHCKTSHFARKHFFHLQKVLKDFPSTFHY